MAAPLSLSLTLPLALPLMKKSLYLTIYRLPLVQECFSVITEVVAKSDDDESFLEFDKKKIDVCIKYYKVLIDPIAESKVKKKGTKTDKEVLHV